MNPFRSAGEDSAFSPETPPPGGLSYAVVIGADINALGIVRSLAGGAVPAIVVGPPRGLAMASRHASDRLALPDTGDPRALAQALQQIVHARPGQRGMIFPTEEKTVFALAQNPDCLPESLFLRPCDADILMPLTRKDEFQQIALARGFPVPRALLVRGVDDLPGLQALRYPCVFKPNYRNYQYGGRFKKAYKVSSAEEAASLYREIAPVMPEMIAQEWIEGDDSSIYFCLQYIGQDGEPVASFTGRKLRSWPPQVGGTASCIPAPEPATELTRITRDFFRQTGFRGMGSMEYKRDSRDGRFYMVEPTVGRTDFQEEVATLNGVNLPLAAFRYESRLPAPGEAEPRPAILWRDTTTERRSRLAHPVDVSRLERGLRRADAIWRVNDPGPGLAALRGKIRSRFF